MHDPCYDIHIWLFLDLTSSSIKSEENLVESKSPLLQVNYSCPINYEAKLEIPAVKILCPIRNCPYKTTTHTNLKRHLKMKHKMRQSE